MHELAATQSIISQVMDICNREKIVPKKIFLSIGEYTTYKSEPMKYYFDLLKKENELLRNCLLECVEVPGSMICKHCGESCEHMFCVSCGLADVIVHGKDLIITKIES